MLLSGVRSSCDMFARNSDLYLDDTANCSAFSSRDLRAPSISAFFCSTSLFCPDNCCAFSSSSSLVRRSSSCCSRNRSSDSCRVRACSCNLVFVSVNSDCRVCNSPANVCDCFRSSSVRMVAVIVFSMMPMISES